MINQEKIHPYTNMFRGGISIEGYHSPCYFPQYDTTWIPIISYNLDTTPELNDSQEGKLSYLCNYEPEFGHKLINYRNSVGFIHFAFASIKINQLFYWLPQLKDIDRTLNDLMETQARASAFFNSTKIWDETFSLLHTAFMGHLFGLDNFVYNYEKLCLEHYPCLQGPYSQLMYIYYNLKDDLEEKNRFINALFNESVPADVLPIFEIDTDKTIPLNLNVDSRFSMMLSFCESFIRKEHNINVETMEYHLCHFAREKDIDLFEGHEPGDLEEILENIEEDYLDGLYFRSLYCTLYRQLMRDCSKLRKPFKPPNKVPDYPVSALTLRITPGQGTTVFPVIRESFLFINENVKNYFMSNYSIDCDLNMADSFYNFFHLGLIADAVIDGASKGWQIKPVSFSIFNNDLLDEMISIFSTQKIPDDLNKMIFSSLQNISRKEIFTEKYEE